MKLTFITDVLECVLQQRPALLLSPSSKDKGKTFTMFNWGPQEAGLVQCVSTGFCVTALPFVISSLVFISHDVGTHYDSFGAVIADGSNVECLNCDVLD